MKYSKFCCYKPHISSLTNKEIESPYLVLDELFTKRTMEDFQNSLWTLQRTIFKDNEWRNYDPADFYIFCYDLIRFTDTLWLVNKYSPGLSSSLNNIADESSEPGLMDNLNRLFTHHGNKDAHEENDKSRTVLSNFFDYHYNGFNRSDLYCYLQLALDASYMRNDKYEYFCMEDHKLASDFFNLSELIEEGYKIYQHGAHILPRLPSCKETKLAIDYDRPTLLSYECIAKPHDLAGDFFLYYLDIYHIHSGLDNWKALLYEKDFWKKANNPGNLIYLYECLIKLIESIWMMCVKNDLEKYTGNYKIKTGETVSLARNCSLEEQANPLLAIQRFFAFKKMHEWRTLLHKWLVYSLSNSEKNVPKNQYKTDLAFNQLLKLLEASHLIFNTQKEAEDIVDQTNP
ncbi:hypothetical protein [Pedobacter psychroterrae]|uniref:Uncharacterized protein n=1 Tax=Pedobacter psychroterrae TaxID=2530453 RepID=A0A4R0NWY1_9SPHI|nr:hypothetical protein [Pedobacter psychroterrae]TCD03574.1 hypothetical protein EZ437_06355 [Pedobacter psychroterrae]